MSTISRRAFLKTVGVGALSVAAMSVLAGCDVAPSAPAAGATTVEAKVGNTYKVSDLMTVSTTGADNKVAATTKWADAYVGAYKEYKTDVVSGGVTSETEYEKLNAAQKADVKAAAEKAASLADADTASVTITVNYYGEDTLVIAESGKDGAFNSSAFTATCNGVALKCTVDQAVVTNSDGAVECTVELPTNAKTFEIVVALPGADKILKYTYENSEYLELDPTSSKFYA